jgi:hypothetical protein
MTSKASKGRTTEKDYCQVRITKDAMHELNELKVAMARLGLGAPEFAGLIPKDEEDATAVTATIALRAAVAAMNRTMQAKT